MKGISSFALTFGVFVTLRVIIATLAVLAGCVIAVLNACDGAWFSFAVALEAGFLAGVCVLLGFAGSRESVWVKLGGGLLLLSGILAVVNEKPAFDLDRSKANQQLALAFADPGFECISEYAEMQRLRDRGISACSTQGIKDIGGAATELSKAQHLGAGATLADGAYAQIKGSAPDHCFEAYLAAKKLCPHAFSSLEKPVQVILEKYESSRKP
ncbi:hypothetical protein HUS84_31225 [Pseudomonas chlororaphis]|uniref:hypothetical protein n=1 Tax=Pseudomonas chlororaphis TaxID=587753 RepID=UPI001B31BF61|nr:hypothetical protein [Pseudomonas chlororaphis]MBP5078349.1 hypothetical protein [Pseudomonas chlororaphis]